MHSLALLELLEIPRFPQVSTPHPPSIILKYVETDLKSILYPSNITIIIHYEN